MTGPFRPPTGGPAGAPGQGGQPPVHPTVGNLGMPGAPVTHETPRYAPPQGAPPAGGGWQMPPAPQQPPQTFDAPQNGGAPNNGGFVPPTQPPAGWGGQPAQGQPPQNQPPQGQPQRVEIPDHVIFDGANVPPELRGRSWGQVKQIYGALANDFVMRQGNPAPAAPARPNQTPARPPVYEQGVPNGGQPPRAANNFWEDPGAFIEQAIDTRVERIMAPVTQRTTAMAITEARNVAASGIPDWQQLEPEILQIVAGAAPDALTDPRLWQSTAELARGRMMGRGEYQPGRQQNGQPQQAPVRGPGAYVPAPMNPAPVGAFFSEAPTPPQYGQENGYNGNNDLQARVNALTPEQLRYAERMQMSPMDYVMWQGGVQPTQPTRRY